MHKTVFKKEAIDLLQLERGMVVVDCTFGEGGHSKEILNIIGSEGRLIAFDQDPEAIEIAEEFKKMYPNFLPIHQNFSQLAVSLEENNIQKVDAILFDLGLSQGHLDRSGRGFSFRHDEPLDMRMNPNSELSAKQIVNSYPEKALADLIFKYGEERASRKIAKEIVSVRRQKKIESTFDLVDCVKRVKRSSGRINPATQTFQALRIEVNNELGIIEDAIEQSIKVLSNNRRVAIISFHSLEDRIVKNVFREKKQKELLKLITKKPLQVSSEERRQNPRSRSAKLRVAEKI